MSPPSSIDWDFDDYYTNYVNADDPSVGGAGSFSGANSFGARLSNYAGNGSESCDPMACYGNNSANTDCELIGPFSPPGPYCVRKCRLLTNIYTGKKQCSPGCRPDDWLNPTTCTRGLTFY